MCSSRKYSYPPSPRRAFMLWIEPPPSSLTRNFQGCLSYPYLTPWNIRNFQLNWVPSEILLHYIIMRKISFSAIKWQKLFSFMLIRRQAVCVTTHKGSWVKLLMCLISIVTRSNTQLVREVDQTEGSKHCFLL